MLSRTANAVYWMNRYIERAESIARFIDVNLLLMMDLPEVTALHWEALTMTTGDIELFHQNYKQADQASVIRFLTFDSNNPSSIFSSIRATRENARSIRETISSDMWEQINTFYLVIKEAKIGSVQHAPHNFFSNIKKECFRFHGALLSTMSQGEAWHFSQLGGFLERADKTARILDVLHFMPVLNIPTGSTPLETIQWLAVLKSVSALDMYRQRYRGISTPRICEFLILDSDFPRSIHHCLIRAQQSLRILSGPDQGKRFRNKAERYLGKLHSEMDYCDIEEILEAGLHEFLDRIELNLNQIDTEIHNTFFAKKEFPDFTSVQTQSQSQKQIFVENN
ncbi:MAG: alpha-E domain-containing protein [SAR324 cluster bacterium]|nr:alpha-E domain-containing protein [SAR324 cluster bacterium]